MNEKHIFRNKTPHKLEMFLDGILSSKISFVTELGPNFLSTFSMCLHISFHEWQLEEFVDCPDFFY